MNPQTDWLTALIILAAGLVLGMLFLFKSRRRQENEDTLELRLDALVERLRDDGLDPAERVQLETETADVLRQIDARPAMGTAPASSFLASMMKGLAWGVTTFAVLGALGYMVATKASPRTPDPVAAAPAAQPEIAALEKQLAADPSNDVLRMDLARTELQRDNLMGVFEHTKIVLERNPDHSGALTMQAMVRAAMGEADVATQLLERATKSDPTNLDARVAMAWVHARNGRMSEAEKTIAEAVRAVPAEKELLDKVLVQIRTKG
jgi:thioredoxin-like negative regulator of GroEL